MLLFKNDKLRGKTSDVYMHLVESATFNKGKKKFILELLEI